MNKLNKMKNIIKLLKITLKSSRRYGLMSGIQLLKIAFKTVLYRPKFISMRPMRYLNFEINAPNPRLLLALVNEIFINEEYLCVVNQANKNNPLIIDAGANIGVSLLYWQQNFTNPKILAFEPARNLVEILKMNISNNNINAQIEDVALGAFEGSVKFFTDDNHLTTGSTNEKRGGRDYYEVKLTSS